MGGGRGAEFFVDRGGGIALRQRESLGGDEIPVGGNRVIGTARGLQCFRDHPCRAHRTTADRV